MTLRELREQRGLSLTPVCEATGINRGTLSKIERGLATPTAEELVRLCGFYDVDLARVTPRVHLWIEED